jgi:hypothetical protein
VPVHCVQLDKQQGNVDLEIDAPKQRGNVDIRIMALDLRGPSN